MQGTVWTRHAKTCTKKHNRFWRQCNCMKWVYWHSNGKMHRESANTRSWEKATRKARALERKHELIQQGQKPKPSEPTTIAVAVKDFLAEKRVEGRAPETIAKLSVLFEKQLLAWSLEQGLYYLADLDVPHLRSFRQAIADGSTTRDQKRKNSPLSLQKKHERLIGFFHFCIRNKWIEDNPAARLSRIKPSTPPTDYFPREEMDKIIDATYVYDQKLSRAVGEMTNNSTRLRTLTLLLRWSGLSLGDGATLARHRQTGRERESSVEPPRNTRLHSTRNRSAFRWPDEREGLALAMANRGGVEFPPAKCAPVTARPCMPLPRLRRFRPAHGEQEGARLLLVC